MSARERAAGPGETAFFKSVGGYDTLVKVRGKWYWVCGAGGSKPHLEFCKFAEQRGVKLVRVGTPVRLKRAWKRHGATWATVVATFPQWTTEVGF